MQAKGAVVATKDLVLIGGGHAHVAVLRHFAMKPLPGVRLTVISRDVDTPYSGMLPGFVAGLYDHDDIHIDLGPLAALAGARLYHDEAIGLDLDQRRVLCRGRPPVPYDVLSIDTGSTPQVDDVPGAAGNVVPVKPISRFIPQWRALHERVMARPGSRIAFVGEGAGGVELLMATEARFRRDLGGNAAGRPLPEYHLFARSDAILPGFGASARRRIERIMRERGVTIRTNEPVVRVDPGRLHTASGADFAFDEIVWVTSAAAPGWPASSGLAVDERGFIKVDETLRSVSHPDVFAAGDVASVEEHPRPKAGVFAVRQGMPLAQNLRRALRGEAVRPFRPQSRFLTILGDGNRCAVARRGGWSVEGRWVWAWKDRIDRRFMRRYNELPEMASATTETAEDDFTGFMRCGGCGAKVGSTALTNALSRLSPATRGDLVIGLDAPDDAAVVAVPPGFAMVHSVDYFRAIVDDPYLFGQIAANHSLGDLYAMGGAPQSVLAIATLPYGPEAKTEDLLFQLMAGATKVIEAAGAALVGGHSSEGAELAMGFAVNGLVDPAAILRKGGMRAGQFLVLTKALGTGTLFAAAMRGKAKARWIDGALTGMVQSAADAAGILRRFGATACTDVTGFGLAGHLAEMTRAAGLDVRLSLTSLPVLDGATETARGGILSSLQPQNRRAENLLNVPEALRRHDFYPLLFDPQTAGGLLASVPADAADACVAALRAAGYAQACTIGMVLPYDPLAERIAIDP